MEQTYRWAAKASGPVLALVGAMVLSNLKITPTQSPTYEAVNDYLVPVAIPLLLMRADVRRIVRTTGTTFAAFHVSALGTIVGALLAAWLFRGAFEKLPEVTGIMTASYTGWAVNFFAVKESFEVPENLTNPLLVAELGARLANCRDVLCSESRKGSASLLPVVELRGSSGQWSGCALLGRGFRSLERCALHGAREPLQGVRIILPALHLQPCTQKFS